MSINIQAAIYARVSSEHQASANTIASQLAALRERLDKDRLSLPSELEFIDEGYSGATLVRPGLEKLRDLIAFSTIDRLYEVISKVEKIANLGVKSGIPS
jgi:site-specific DNA recombinase